jgi:ferric-dicitrate binding protein FerR (iron transport regulator)
MSPACFRAGTLVERREHGLADAERLWLETHLAECADCARAAATLDGIATAMRTAHWELGANRRRRVLERALRGPRDRVSAEPARSRRPAAALLIAAAAITVALVWPQSVDQPRLLSARAVASAAETPRRQRAPELEKLDAPAGARLEVGGARIDVQRAALLRWRAADRALELVAGAVRIEVVPGAGRSFRVTTERMQVEVLGTVFEVDLESVSVARGRVRVSAPSGAALATLEAGQRFELDGAAKKIPPPRASIDAAITRARSELARGNVKAARTQLTPLSRQRLEAKQDAEVESLLAECSLLEGDPAAAARAYGEVAERHAGSLAGETALFTKARAELRAMRRAEARASLRRYLERYPNGRFHAEALRHLRTLEKQP